MGTRRPWGLSWWRRSGKVVASRSSWEANAQLSLAVGGPGGRRGARPGPPKGAWGGLEDTARCGGSAAGHGLAWGCGGWAEAEARRWQRGGRADTIPGSGSPRAGGAGLELGAAVPSLEPGQSRRELCPGRFPRPACEEAPGVLAGKQV